MTKVALSSLLRFGGDMTRTGLSPAGEREGRRGKAGRSRWQFQRGGSGRMLRDKAFQFSSIFRLSHFVFQYKAFLPISLCDSIITFLFFLFRILKAHHYSIQLSLFMWCLASTLAVSNIYLKPVFALSIPMSSPHLSNF